MTIRRTCTGLFLATTLALLGACSSSPEGEPASTPSAGAAGATSAAPETSSVTASFGDTDVTVPEGYRVEQEGDPLGLSAGETDVLTVQTVDVGGLTDEQIPAYCTKLEEQVATRFDSVPEGSTFETVELEGRASCVARVVARSPEQIEVFSQVVGFDSSAFADAEELGVDLLTFAGQDGLVVVTGMHAPARDGAVEEAVARELAVALPQG